MKFKAKFSRRAKNALSLPQELALLVGDCDNAFPSNEARRQAWAEHRTELKELMKGGTCWAEVMFDLGGFLPEEGWHISRALARLGVRS